MSPDYSPSTTLANQALPNRSPLLQARSPVPSSRARQSPRIERRISNLPPSWNLNDDAGPQHHHRAPSLGELHQELESEQEAAVNRLLGQIRQQETQIQTQNQTTPTSATSIAATPTPSNSLSQALSRSRTPSLSSTRRPSVIPTPASQSQPPRTSSSTQPISLSRQSSYRSSSRTASPSLRPTSFAAESPSPSPGTDWSFMAAARDRDEVAFWQTEAASVMRENKMLEARVRELERLVAEGE